MQHEAGKTESSLVDHGPLLGPRTMIHIGSYVQYDTWTNLTTSPESFKTTSFSVTCEAAWAGGWA